MMKIKDVEVLHTGDKVRSVAMHGYRGVVVDTRGEGPATMYKCKWTNGGITGWLYRVEVDLDAPSPGLGK